MRKSVLAGMGISLLLCSCSTVTYTASTESIKSDIYNLTVADMDVKPERSSLTKSWAWNPFRAISMSVEKTNATAELLKETSSDVLVEPQFEIRKRGLFRGGSITVSGRPATYRNFRPMTTEEAEMVATVKGYAVVNPTHMINTAGPQPLPAPRKPRRDRNYDDMPDMRSFVSLVGGPITNDLTDALQIGLMFGRHGRGWGWYGKLQYTQAEWDGVIGDIKYGFSATAGATWGPTRNFGVFLGAGAGHVYYNGYENRYTEHEIGVMVDAGLRYSYRHFNVMGGLTVGHSINTTDMNYMPFVGIGYNF